MSEELTPQNNRVFPCMFCDEAYTSADDLEMHCQLHRGSNKFVCMVCHESFSELLDLKNHDLLHSLNEANVEVSEFDFFKEVFGCYVCDKKFFSVKELNDHHMSHVTLVNEGSDTSGLQIVEVKSMVASENWPHQSNFLPLSKELTSSNNNNLNKCESVENNSVHDDKPSPLRNFECKFCGKKFHKQVNLGMHLKTHSRPHACRVCDKRFAELKKLRKHILIHEKAGNVKLPCDTCKEIFFSETALSRHFNSFHDLSKKHICDVCSKRFQMKSDYARHKLVHEKKLYVCGFCNLKFTLKLYLKRHLMSHIVNKPFMCAICGKRYTRKSPLMSHLATHDINDSKQPIVHYMSKKENICNDVNLTKSKLRELLNEIN